MKTICIAGKNNIAVDVLLHCKKKYPNYRLICVVNRNESGQNSWQKSVEWFAKKNKIEILELKDTYDIEELLFISCEFDRIVKPEKFKTSKLYNIHFSLLPRYKGCFPSVLPILYGDNVTGVTLHRMRAGIDTGEIVDQKKVLIEEKDSSLDLYRKLISQGTDMVINNLDKLLLGDVKCKRQPKKNSFYFPSSYINFDLLSMDINQTAFQIQNQIRAFSFRPYQLLSWNNERYLDSIITDNASIEKPGTILESTEVYTMIATVDYDIILFKDTLRKAMEIVKNGGDAVSLCMSKKVIESQDEHGWSLLTVAVYNNNKNMVEWLINNGADVNIVNNNGTTLLMYAKDCFINSKDAFVFDLLLKKGASIDAKDYYGLSLIDYCQMQGIHQIGAFVID